MRWRPCLTTGCGTDASVSPIITHELGNCLDWLTWFVYPNPGPMKPSDHVASARMAAAIARKCSAAVLAVKLESLFLLAG